jgi:uncharacterized membrane protein YkoI
MKKKTLWITSAAAATALVLGGAGIAVAVGDPFDTDDTLSGSTLERASSAALTEVGEGTVTGTETSDDAGTSYEVEVTRDDGTEVDVELDESFDVVRVDGGSGSNSNSSSGNSSDSPADLPPLTEADRAEASAAALAALPAGTAGSVTEVERSDDHDHAYEVEVTLEDGQDVDIELDENFAVVSVDAVDDVPAA